MGFTDIFSGDGNVSGGGPPLQEDLPSQWSDDCDIKGEGRTITWTREK